MFYVEPNHITEEAMEELRNELKAAYDMASAIPVTGDSVELMAAAKEHLRRAFKLAEECRQEKDEHTKEGKASG